MKILHLMGHGGVGGAERLAISMVGGLIERGHEATLVNTWTNSPLNAAAAVADIPFVALSGGTRRIGLRWLREVGGYLRGHRFDIVHAHGLRVSLGLRFLRRRIGHARHVMTIHGLERQRTRWQALIDRKTEHRVDLVVCVSRAVAEMRTSLVGTPASRLQVITNGIDVSVFSPGVEPPSRESLGLPTGFLVAAVGSFRPEKDHANLLEAIRVGGRRLRAATFVLVGDGDLKDTVAADVDRMELTDRVLFTGAVDDVRPILRACDAFVMSSHSEGMPCALMEAMALGKPVVSTAVGGVTEVAEHEKHALLVPARSPEALADGLVRLMEDPALRIRLGTAAAERIRSEFSHDSMIDRHLDMYESLLRDGGDG